MFNVRINHYLVEFLDNSECIIIIVTSFFPHSIVIYMVTPLLNCKIFEVKNPLPHQIDISV